MENDNIADMDMFSTLQTDTEVQNTPNPTQRLSEDKAFVKKCIHPPSCVAEYKGLPTNDVRSQVCIEWRGINVNVTPRIADPKTSKVRELVAADLTTFDYAFLSTSGGRVLNVPFINVNGTYYQDLANVMINDQYEWKNWGTDANLFRPSYKSTTFYLNATAFNDTGIVSGNQFNPSLLFRGSVSSFAHQRPDLFYKFVIDGVNNNIYSIIKQRNIDYHRVAEKWENIPKYHRDEIAKSLNMEIGDAISLDPSVQIQILNISTAPGTELTSIVPSQTQILQSSIRSLAAKAKEGMFSIQRLNTVTPAWMSSTNGFITEGEIPGLYLCYYYVVAPDGSSHFVPFFENTAVGVDNANVAILQDTMWTQDLTWSWVKFSGLAMNSQVNLSTQLIIRKTYLGMEVQPAMKSAWAGMMKLGPKPSLEAMEALMDAFYELKDVMPARYNFWQALGSIASQGLQTFGKSLLDSLMGNNSKPENKPKERNSNRRVNTNKSTSREKEMAKQIESLNRKLDRLSTKSKPRPIGPVRHRSDRAGMNKNVPDLQKIAAKPKPKRKHVKTA